MNKYRIKIGDRVLGPLTVEQIVELYKKSHIEGEEDCQIFPAGEWKSLINFPEVVAHISSSLSDKDSDPLEAEGSEIEAFNYNDIEEVEEESSSADLELTKNKKVKSTNLINEIPVEKFSSRDSELEKTRVINLSRPIEIEKTVVIKIDELVEEIEEVADIVPPKPDVSFDEKTSMFDLATLDELKAEVVESVEELKKLTIEEEMLGVSPIEEEDSSTDHIKKKRKVKKTISPVLALVFIGLLYFLLVDEEKPEVINPQYLNYSFPIANNFIDEKKSQEQFALGLKSYKKNTYLSKVLAISFFKKSLAFKFRDNKALNYLILDYAELLPNAKDQIKARAVLYKLSKISRAKILKNANVAIGLSLLYYHSGLAETAYETIENYLRAGGKPTLKVYAYYLKIMIRANKFENLEKVAQKLLKVKKKTALVYLSLAEYYLVNENFDAAAKLIKEGATKYKTSVALLLKYADIVRDQGKAKQLRNILKLVEALKVEQSPVYYAKLLEHLGVVSAAAGDTDQAAKHFKTALFFYDDFELRDKLSQLSLGGGKIASSLISSSKISNISKEINILLDRGELESALLKAVTAVDMAPNSVKANLLLANLQRKRGYLKETVKTLESLHHLYPQNGRVLHALALSYLDAHRLVDAKRLLVSVMNTKFSKSFYYNSLLGRYYLKTKNTSLAIKWLRKSIKLNPLYHKDYFALANLYTFHKKFKLARVRLGEAISLAPNNLEYKILFSKIYYETDGTDAAIGYLRNILKKHPQNPRVLGEITIYYYRSGQTRAFERYKKKIDNLFEKDASVYKFLFKMAKLEGDNIKAINFGLKVLQFTSSQVDLLMELGVLYIEIKDYNNAISVFKDVAIRIPTYPKVHYLLSEIFLKQGKLVESEKEADEEIKLNPKSELGYYAKARIKFQQENYAVANKFLERSVSLNVKFVDGLKLLALIKKRQNYLDQAKELFLRARSVDQGDADIHKELGEIFEKTGQRALALESYKVYLDIAVRAKDRSRIESKIRSLR